MMHLTGPHQETKRETHLPTQDESEREKEKAQSCSHRLMIELSVQLAAVSLYYEFLILTFLKQHRSNADKLLLQCAWRHECSTAKGTLPTVFPVSCFPKQLASTSNMPYLASSPPSLAPSLASKSLEAAFLLRFLLHALHLLPFRITLVALFHLDLETLRIFFA